MYLRQKYIYLVADAIISVKTFGGRQYYVYLQGDYETMIKVHTDISDIEVMIKEKVRCPVCGKMMFDLRHAKGIIMLRVKCPRCKSYINVDVAGD